MAVPKVAGPALLFVIVILFNWKLVLSNQFTWLDSPDLASQVLPWFQFQAGEWHAGRFPLWDPNDWGGQPLQGQMQPGSAYPLNWVTFLFPLNHGWLRQDVLHWYFVLIRYLGALTCFALCRDLGRSMIASLIGACVFSLGGYVAHTDWPQMINGAVWAPLVFLFLLRVERGVRPLGSALLSGFFLGVAWLAGHHQIPILLSLAAAGTWLWLCLRRGRPDFEMARLALFSLGVAILASGFQTVPAAEYGAHAVRWSGTDKPLHFNQPVPYSVHQQYAMRPTTLLGIFIPGMAGYADPYAGAVATALALLGVILAWKKRAVRFLAALACAGLLFALGGNSIFNGMLYAVVPLVEKARSPAAAIVLLAVALATLAAFGFDGLASPRSSNWSRRASWTLAAVAIVMCIAGFLAWAWQKPLEDDRMMITALCALVAACLLAAWGRRTISIFALGVAALGLIVCELALETNYSLPEASGGRFLTQLSEHADLVEFVKSRGRPSRVEYDSEAIRYNIGDWYGLETFDNYTVSMWDELYAHDLNSPQFRDFFGIRYFFAKKPRRPGQHEVFKGASGVSVFENPGALPRVWSVHEFVVNGDGRQIDTGALDVRHKAFLSGGPLPSLELCDPEGDDVQIKRHRPNRVIIQAEMQCRGMVILTDVWSPGWQATVDGKRAPTERAYGLVRGVVVGSGSHVVEMRYRPWSVFTGAAISLLAGVIAAAGAKRGR